MRIFQSNSRSLAAHTLPLAALLQLGVVACGAESGGVATNDRAPGGGVETGSGPNKLGPTVSELNPEQLESIETVRLAIDRGLVLGKYALADELNITLGDKDVTHRYTASLDTGVEYVKPEAKSCPFIEAAGAGKNIDCRELVTHATVSAYAQLSTLKESNPLGPEFDSVREESEFWFDEAIATGIDNEGALGLHAIRDVAACDQAPQPVQSAFEAGVERGRQVYIDKVNARLIEAGYSMSYPDNIQPIEACQADTTLLAPARSRALEATDAEATANPLCPDYKPVTLEQVALRDDAERQFADGLSRGVETEHSLAEETLFRLIPCSVCDPLVLDIDGDGVELVPATRSTVRFDLYGVGSAIKVSWVQGDDALLALDRNGNGRIDDGRELFGNFIGHSGFDEVPSGFDHLALYDQADRGGNEDGVISAEDRVFGELVVWQDKNGDGISQARELRSLDEVGIESIALRYTDTDDSIDDRQLTHHATFTRTEAAAKRVGSTSGDVYDAWLRHGRFRVGK